MTDSLADRPSARVAALLAAGAVDREVLVRLLGPGDAGQELLAGKRLPTLDEATALGAYLGVSPAVLLGEAPAPIGVSLRLGALEGVSDVAEVVGHAAKLLEADRVTSDWGFAAPRRTLDGFALARDGHAITAGKKTAVRLRGFLGVGDNEAIGDLSGLVESLGHPVEHRLIPRLVHGLAVQERRVDQLSWVVLVNSGDQWGRQRYTLAHELCHVLYGDEGQVIVERADPGEKLIELRAESFAHHLLLPEAGIYSVIDEHGLPRSGQAAARLVADIALRYGASKQATLIAIQGKIPSSLHEQCVDMSARALLVAAGRASEWEMLVQEHGRPAPSARLTAQVLQAFSQRLVGLRTVADVISSGNVSVAAQELANAGWGDLVEAQSF